MLPRPVVSIGLLALLAPASAGAGDPAVVVERFTSQGCSSCPPANAYLNEMARDRRDVLPLAFHVTYWDRLGWKDPFSPSGGPPAAELVWRAVGGDRAAVRLWPSLWRWILHA